VRNVHGFVHENHVSGGRTPMQPMLSRRFASIRPGRTYWVLTATSAPMAPGVW
jgi:hypothetical protein